MIIRFLDQSPLPQPSLSRPRHPIHLRSAHDSSAFPPRRWSKHHLHLNLHRRSVFKFKHVAQIIFLAVIYLSYLLVIYRYVICSAFIEHSDHLLRG